MNQHQLIPWIVVPMVLVSILGCDEDRRLVELARESTARQAEQNRQMADVTRRAAEATQRVVEAQTNLDQQRHELDSERKQIATQRHRDPLIAAAISTSVILLACLLPLVFSIYVLRCASCESSDNTQLAELLVLEMTTDQPRFLERLPPPMLDSPTPPALPPSQAA